MVKFTSTPCTVYTAIHPKERQPFPLCSHARHNAPTAPHASSVQQCSWNAGTADDSMHLWPKCSCCMKAHSLARRRLWVSYCIPLQLVGTSHVVRSCAMSLTFLDYTDWLNNCTSCVPKLVQLAIQQVLQQVIVGSYQSLVDP
jgi:hypothetical protein